MSAAARSCRARVAAASSLCDKPLTVGNCRRRAFSYSRLPVSCDFLGLNSTRPEGMRKYSQFHSRSETPRCVAPCSCSPLRCTDPFPWRFFFSCSDLRERDLPSFARGFWTIPPQASGRRVRFMRFRVSVTAAATRATVGFRSEAVCFRTLTHFDEAPRQFRPGSPAAQRGRS